LAGLHAAHAPAAQPVALQGAADLPDWITAIPRDGIELDGQAVQARDPRGVVITADADLEPLRVGRQAGSLYFLHTLEPGEAPLAYQRSAVEAKDRGDLPEELPTVLVYRVTYADGRSLDVPVRWDESIHDARRDDFWDFKYGMFADLDWASLAASTPTGEVPGQVATAYLMRWPNPRPDVAIASILPVMDHADAGTAYLLAAGTADALEPGDVYFVSPDGSDDADGSFDTPWQNPFAAMNQLTAGDTLYVRGGLYQPTDRLVKAFQGTADQPITISGYPGETATFDAQRYTFSSDPAFADVTDRSPFASRNGFFHLDGSKHTTVRGLLLKNLISIGVCVINVEHVAVEHNTFYFGPASAIYLAGRHSRANHNTAIRPCSRGAVDRHIAFDPSRINDPIVKAQKDYLDARRIRGGFGDEGIDVGGTGSYDLEGAYNEICWSDKEAMDVKGGPEKIRIHHNYAHHNNFWVSLYIDGWTRPMRDIEMSHNVSTSNWGIGFAVNVEHGPLVENVRIHNNLSFNNGLAGFESGGAGDNNFRKNISIERNTFYNNGNKGWENGDTGGVRISSSNVENIRIRQNLFVDNRDYHIGLFGPDYARKGVRVEHNLTYPKKQTGWLPGGQHVYNVSGDHARHVRPEFVDPQAGNFRVTNRDEVGNLGAYATEPSR
jgi:hypothetical protein